MLEPPTISPVAAAQLAAWEKLAADWTFVEGIDSEFPNVRMLRCASCFGGIYRLTDDTGTAYQYSPEQQLALTVAHLRQSHLELDPDRVSIAEDYERIAAEESDMHGHMGFLRHCAEKFDAPRIIELGTRTGRSTVAFLAGIGGGHLWSVDVRDPQPPADGWRGLDCWSFLRADDISDLAYRWLPARADILFIDTSHEYEHTCVELAMYAPRVAMGGLILMHDTEYPEINGVRPSAHESEVGRALDWWCPRHPRYGGMWENRTGSYGMGVMRVI